MFRLRRQINTSAMLFALTLSAWSQTAGYTVPAASLGNDFSAYHHALNTAADLALAQVAQEPPVTIQITEVAPSTMASPDGEAVHEYARQFWNGNDEAVRRAVARVLQLRPILNPIFREKEVPREVAALVLVESAGQPTALSPQGARGVWQFMPNTARRYGLAVTAGRDERVDVVKSTRAAARYLHDLYQRFGDWRLAFAAYNAGEQAVERAMIRTGSADFSRIARALPEETRTYVPAVLQAMELLGNNRRDGLPAGEPKRSPARSILYASTERAD